MNEAELVTRGRARALAPPREVAEAWLLVAARDVAQARAEWETYGVAALRCGGLFSAVRIPAAIVYAAAGTTAPGALAAYCAEALRGGPIFHDRSGQAFYALTPHSTSRIWKIPDTECLGSDSFLGVPPLTVTAPDPLYPAYWVVPMDAPAVLCMPSAVALLVQRGRALIAEEAAHE